MITHERYPLHVVPAPRKKQFRYLGVFAANAKWRREVVLRPKPAKRKKELANGETACEHAAREAKPDDTQPGHALSACYYRARLDLPPSIRQRRACWSQAMRRTFKLDVLQCTCGGRREVIAPIPSGEIATKILAHLHLPVTAEGLLPIRAPPWDDDLGRGAANDEVDLPFFDQDAA